MGLTIGYDIGVNSIGYAIIKQSDEGTEPEIIKMGVRIIPEDKDFHGNYVEGKTASKNEARTTFRSIRRNNQRFKLRRDYLYRILKENDMFPTDELMYKLPPIQLYQLRAKAVEHKLSLKELGRVFILLNQRRGFNSNKKFSSDGNLSEYKEQINNYESQRGDLTIGQQLYKELKEDVNKEVRGRTYLRSSYMDEFDKIWDTQAEYYPDLMQDSSKGSLYDKIKNRIIFYQRPLKSQKHLIKDCQFEKRRKVAPKSSPYFQVSRIYQELNNFQIQLIDTGDKLLLSRSERNELFNHLVDPRSNLVTKSGKITKSRLLKFLGYEKDEVILNIEEFQAHKTIFYLYDKLKESGVEEPLDMLKIENFLNAVKENNFIHTDLYQLWHITFSIPEVDAMSRKLKDRFHLTKEQAEYIAKNVGYTSEYGSLSTKAMRNIMPYLLDGLNYSEACNSAGYDHSGYKTETKLLDKLELLKPNSIRNPVVEQVLNQVINLTNMLIEKYGKPDAIKVELARELKNNYKQREEITRKNRQREKRRDKYRKVLKEDFGLPVVNNRDLQRYTLYEETNKKCLYCGQNISKADFLNGNAEIEHIIPRSRSFNDSMQNKILAHRSCNKDKGQLTAFEFMKGKVPAIFEQYKAQVEKLYAEGKRAGKISWTKYNNLLKSGEKLSEDAGFLSRQINDTQYISKKAIEILSHITHKVYPTSGGLTSFFRDQWGLNHILQQAVLPKYQKIGYTKMVKIKDQWGNYKDIEVPDNWSKRDDHRHHAVDALVVALTTPKMVFYLNNLHKRYQYKNKYTSKARKEEIIEKLQKDNPEIQQYTLKAFLADDGGYKEIPAPIKNLRNAVMPHLNKILISYKKDELGLSESINRIQGSDKIQRTIVPRGPLHEDTVRRRIKIKRWEALNKKFTLENVENIVSPVIQERVKAHLEEYDNKPQQAFAKKNIEKGGLTYKGKFIHKVKIWDYQFLKSVSLETGLTSAQVKKIYDPKIKKLIDAHIAKYGGNLKEAFNDYFNDPIYLDNEKAVVLKTISVTDDGKYEAIRTKSDHKGNPMLKNDEFQPIDFVKTGSNHHALIYKDEKGNYHERIKSLWEVAAEGTISYENKGDFSPIIDRRDIPEKGWKFQFSIQKNDLFILGLELERKDYFKEENRELISKHLYRVQKFSKSYYVFRHHLETTLDRKENALKSVVWERYRSLPHLKSLRKVHLNAIGDIIKIGE